MSTLAWITVSGLAMSAIALVGSVTLVLQEATLQKILLPMVALAAGSLIGSALTFLLGGIITYLAASRVDVTLLVPFAAGTFIYIGASDLVPEVNKHENSVNNVIHYSIVCGRHCADVADTVYTG